MPAELQTLIEGLITGAGGGAIVVAIVVVVIRYFHQIGSKYFEARVVEPVKHRFSEQLALTTHELGKKLVDYQSELQFKVGAELKAFETKLAEQKKEIDLIENIEMLELPVLQEAGRIIYRIDEVMCGRFASMYSVNWNPEALSIEDLDGNKKATAVYRLMRFFASYYMYQRRCSGLPFHPARSRLEWYVEKKLIPVFASGGYPDNPLMYRDTIMELSEDMLDKSTKWDAVSPIRFATWIDMCKGSETAVSLVSQDLANLFSIPSIRLALLGIFLIDIRQDFRSKNREHEDVRTGLLRWLQKHVDDPQSVSIWGMTQNGKTDLSEMDVAKGLLPRNNRSHLFDNGSRLLYNVRMQVNAGNG
jgi:hypothetical protein